MRIKDILSQSAIQWLLVNIGLLLCQQVTQEKLERAVGVHTDMLPAERWQRHRSLPQGFR